MFYKTSLLLFASLLIACSRPVAQFSHSTPSKQYIAPVAIAFKNTSQKAAHYEWNFGDGSTSSEESPVHQFASSGNYLVTLKAIKGKKQQSTQQRVQVKPPHACQIEITTDFGTMLLELYNATPLHRDNFIKLVQEGFFDGLLFHRVINGFMIQGGDPDSRNAPAGEMLGMGDVGYQIPAEFVDSLLHIKGALAAARTNNPEKKSSGCQFYIVQGKPIEGNVLENFEKRKGILYSPEQKNRYAKLGGTPQLDHEYTVFGRIVSGLEVIDKIASTKTDANDRPLQDVRMKIRIID